MNAAIFDLLQKIRTKHGPGEFGKIAQKLLAIAFCQLGYSHIEERGVQGVDIDAGKDSSKYAVEVKTTEGDEVQIKEKDVNGLKRRVNDNYTPVFAILKVSLLSDWIIASAQGIPKGSIRIGRFSTQPIQPLQNEVNGIFGTVVTDYGSKILTARRGQAQALADEFLRAEKNKSVSDSMRRQS